MIGNPKIIRASEEQIDLLIPLFDGYRQFYAQDSDPEGARAFLTERLGKSESVILLALNEGQGCGFTQLYPAFSSVAMRPIWILNDLFVAPDSRRLGVGRCLIRRAIDFATEQRAKRLVLCTAVDNRTAQLLYEDMGWVRDSAFQHYQFDL